MQLNKYDIMFTNLTHQPNNNDWMDIDSIYSICNILISHLHY